MESLTSKEFFEKLKNNDLKPASILMGIVKKSESDKELMFAGKGNFKHWTAIPATMIEAVKILKNFTHEEINYTFVKLRLQAPTNPEAEVLFDLLMASVPSEMHHEGSCGMNKSTCGSEHHSYGEDFGHKEMQFGGCGCQHCHCGCAYQQQSHGYGCGTEKHCGCH